MSERDSSSDIKFLLIMGFLCVVVGLVLFAIKDSEVRDLQRRVGQLESERR